MPRALRNEYPGAACHTIVRLGWTSADADYRRGEYFQELVSVVNSSTSVWQRVAVTNTGGSWSTGNVFVAKTAEAFTYDADGNLTSDGRWTYAWDAENRLINMTSGSSTPTGSKFKMDFAYDWKGRRIEKQVSTNNGSYFGQYTNRYVYDGWNLVAELNSTNGLIRGYVWGLDLSGSEQGAGGVGGLLAVNDATNGLHFCGYDGNGNLAVLTKATDGTVSANYEYGPFGEVLRSSGTMARANPFRFSSKYQDDESDQLYYGYRFYNQSAGRWLSRDPIGERGSIKLYGFVYNDPINNTDTLGLKLSDKEKKCCKCLVFAEGGHEATCQQAVLMVLASRQLYASTPPGEKNPFPSSNNEGGFCDQAKKAKTFTGANTDKFRYCMGEKCKVEPTKVEKKLFDQQIGTAAKACDGLDEMENFAAGAYYWWNPELSPTNEGIMAWNIQIGNCVEVPTGCKSIKVYACNSEMKPKGQK